MLTFNYYLIFINRDDIIKDKYFDIKKATLLGGLNFKVYYVKHLTWIRPIFHEAHIQEVLQLLPQC